MSASAKQKSKFDTRELKPDSIPVWRQFRTGLVIITTLLVIIPPAIIVLFGLPQQVAQFQSQLQNQLESVTTLKIGQLEMWLQTGHNTLDMIVTDDNYRPESSPDFVKVLKGGQIDPALITSYKALLAGIKTAGKYFSNLFIYNASGEIVAASDEVLIGRLVTLQPYFSQSLKDDYTQTPYYRPGSNLLEMVLTEPIYNADKQLVAVIAGDVDLAVLGQVMQERTGLTSAGETYLVSAQTNFLLTPSRYPGYNLFTAYRSTGIDNALKGINGAGSYTNYETPGRSVFGVYRWIPELNAAFLAEVDQTSVFLSALQSRGLVLGLLVITISISVLSTIFLAGRIAAPVRSLTFATQRLASGDLEQRVPITNNNELGLLGKSFNSMAGQLQRLFLELDQRIQEATNARRRAEQSEQIKAAFLANMSHELRTPLNAVINFTKFVERGVLGPVNQQQIDMLRKVTRSADHLLRLINDVLDMSKMEAGSLTLFVEENIDLREIFGFVRGTAEGLLTEKPNVQLVVDIAPDLPAFDADSQRLTQVLINLISNACKFTDRGTVKLSVAAQNENIHITVEDSGPGIPPEDYETIFEPFKQTETGLRQGSGTGLGLPIARRLTEAHGGKLWFESELKRGTTFHVLLPKHPTQHPILA